MNFNPIVCITHCRQLDVWHILDLAEVPNATDQTLAHVYDVTMPQQSRQLFASVMLSE